MANNPRPKLPIQVIFAVILAVAAISTAVIVFASRVMPMIFVPTPTTIQTPTTTLTMVPSPSFTETFIVPTDNPTLTGTSTITATNTPAFTFTPTYTSTARLLPDLTITSISASACTRDQRVIPEKLYVSLSIIVRNVGLGSTRPFGPFSVRIRLILGQSRYSLDEWASDFNGVIGSSNMDSLNLSPNGDVKLNLSIDLKGNTKFGVEVIANSGLNTIPESDKTNNTLIEGFSVTCT